MILTEIINYSKNLSANDEELPHNLSFAIFDAYYQHLQDIFNDLFSIHRKVPYLLEKFEQILSDNWELIRGTSLCYTATPYAQATRLFLEIAEYIAHKKKKSHALQYLMPTINPESLTDAYPNLNSISLQEILDTHILAKNYQYLIPIKILTKLDIPTLPESPLYNPYFHEEHHDEQNCIIQPDELERLFQHSEDTEHIRTHRNILKNLMQDQNNLLGQLNLLCDSLRHGSVFEDGDEHQADDIAHDGLMYFTSFYNQLFSKNLHLLDSLPESLEIYQDQYIWLNDEYLFYVDKNNTLIEIKAQQESFENTLITFQNTKPIKIQLTPYQMEQLFVHAPHHWLDVKLPKGLHEEIMFLIKLSTNLESNHEARENMEACVVKRREALLFYIKAHAQQLSQYKVQIHSEEHNLDIAKQNFIDAQNNLEEKLLSNEYNEGYDKLERYAHLLRTFHTYFQIQQLEDLEIFNHLSIKELNKIFNSEELKYEAVLMVPNLNECAALIQDFKPNALTNFINILDEKLKIYILPTSTELNQLLKVIDSEKAGIIIQHIHHLYSLNYLSFIELTEGQSHEHFRIICATLKNVLLNSMTLSEFILFYENLEASIYKESFMECFITDFPSLIENTFDYINLKKYLSQKEDDILFELMPNKLEVIIKNTNDFNNILEQFDLVRRKIFLEKCHLVIPKIIENNSDLINIFEHLDTEEIQLICDLETSFIKTIFVDITHSIEIFLTLEESKQDILYALFKNELFISFLNSNENNHKELVPNLLQDTYSLASFTRNLIHLSGPKIATYFALSLLDDNLSNIKDNFNRFFDSKPYYRFFQSNNNLDQIMIEVYQLPKIYLHKLLNALQLNINTKFEEFMAFIQQNKPDEMSFKKVKC